MAWLRPDEGQPVRRDNLGEIGIFRKKADSGMHGISAGNPGRRDDRGDIEIGIGT